MGFSQRQLGSPTVNKSPLLPCLALHQVDFAMVTDSWLCPWRDEAIQEHRIFGVCICGAI
jgi:hypothetical protein